MKKITLVAFLFIIGNIATSQISFEANTNFGKLQDMTYDATIQNKIYASTQGNHIVVSLDNGLVWSLLYTMPNSRNMVSNLKLTPGNAALSFVFDNQIYFLSTTTNTIVATFPIPQSNLPDAGESYLKSYSLFDASGNTMLVDTGFQIGLINFGKTFYTQNGGTTWQEIYYTLNNDNVFINNVAIHPLNAQMLFLARGLGNGSVDGGLWISLNGGLNWVESLAGNAIDPIAFKPNNTSEILVGSGISFGAHSENIFKSTDNGLTWNALPITWNDETLNNVTKIVFNPLNTNSIIALDENEILRSNNGGTTWTNTAYPAGISVDYYYGTNASYNPFNENQVAITTDIYPQFSNDGGTTITQIKMPFYNVISTSFVSYGAQKHLYYGAQGGRVHKNLQTSVTNEYDLELPTAFNPKKNYIIADPTIPGRVFTYASMGSFGGAIHVSTDFGATKTDILQSFSNDIRDLKVDPNNPNIIYVAMRSGESGQVYKIDFSDLTNIISNEIITPQVNADDNGVITGIIIHETNSNEIYIAKKTKIFKSIDQGITWVEKINGLGALIPDLDLIWDLTKNPMNPNQMAIATSNGVFTTIDGAESWVQTLTGQNIRKLEYSPINNGVIAGAIYSTQMDDTSIIYSIDNGLNWNFISPQQIKYVQSYSIDFNFEGNIINAFIATTDLGVVKHTISNLHLAINNPSEVEVGFAIYPNPALNKVSVKVPNGIEIESITVFSFLGQKVIETKQENFDISVLNTGTYVVKISTTSGKSLMQKLIKE